MVVMWNMWLRGKDRTNSNVYIQGIPGTGKSTLIKFFQLLEYAINDTTQIVWDAEREFIDMARHPWLNADVIDCASGNSTKIQRYSGRVYMQKVQLGFDLYVIPKGAKHADLSEKFLNYICEADVMAKNLEEFPYSCPRQGPCRCRCSRDICPLCLSTQ